MKVLKKYATGPDAVPIYLNRKLNSTDALATLLVIDLPVLIHNERETPYLFFGHVMICEKKEYKAHSMNGLRNGCALGSDRHLSGVKQIKLITDREIALYKPFVCQNYFQADHTSCFRHIDGNLKRTLEKYLKCSAGRSKRIHTTHRCFRLS